MTGRPMQPEKLAQLRAGPWKRRRKSRHNKAAVALANKLVQICWAVWCHERRFNGNWRSLPDGGSYQ